MKFLQTAAAAAGLAFMSGAAAAEPVVLKFGFFGSDRAVTYREVYKPFMDAVNADANGSVRIDSFPGGTLGRAPAQQLKLLQDGVVDIGFVVPGYTAGVFPDDELFELPLLIRDVREASLSMWKLYEQDLLRGYDNVKVLGLFASVATIHTNFNVDDVSALAGKKLRANGPVQTEMVQALQAAPVGMVTTQMAESIDRRLIDGVLLDWNSLESFRLEDVTNYHLDVPMGAVTVMIAMNKEKWESLSDEAKAAFEKHMGRPFVEQYAKSLGANTEKFRDAVAAMPGQTVRALTAEEEAKWSELFQPITDRWIERNPEGRQRYDALLEALAEIRAAN